MTAATPPDAQTRPEPGRAPTGRDGSDSLAGVARGGALNLAGALVAAVTTLALTVVITRQFTKPVAGAFFTATSLFLILEAAAGLGAYVGLVNFIARLRRLGHETRIPAILRFAIIPVVTVSLVATAALILFAGPLARLLLSGHLGHAGASPGIVANALRALALALPFAALSDTLLGATRGYRVMRPTVLVDRVGRASAQLIGVLIAISAGSIVLLAPLWALPYVPAAVVGWYWLRRIRRSQRPEPGAVAKAPDLPGVSRAAVSPGDPGVKAAGPRHRRTVTMGAGVGNATASGFWRFTGPRALATLAQITIQRIDIVLVAIILGPAEAAIYRGQPVRPAAVRRTVRCRRPARRQRDLPRDHGLAHRPDLAPVPAGRDLRPGGAQHLRPFLPGRAPRDDHPGPDHAARHGLRPGGHGLDHHRPEQLEPG
jgi:hypothetical protein